MIIVAVIVYRVIPVIDTFEHETSQQQKKIEEQAALQLEIARQVREKMNQLFKRVDNQNRIADEFSDKVRSQAAGFEEMAASLEELLGSAENIAHGALEQVEGNTMLQNSLGEFREVQARTKSHLELTLGDISTVVASTTNANPSCVLSKIPWSVFANRVTVSARPSA
jgi:methyl-accepting chemotaxis protein